MTSAESATSYGIKGFTGREWDPEIGLYYYRASARLPAATKTTPIITKGVCADGNAEPLMRKGGWATAV